jgi:hypothetical protein
MLDEADDALSCAFSSGLRAVRWSQFGHKLCLSERSSKKSDEWLLRNIFDPHEEVQTRIHSVTIVANLSSNSGQRQFISPQRDLNWLTVPYANMRKTAIEHHPLIIEMIVTGTRTGPVERKYSVPIHSNLPSFGWDQR